MLPDARQPSATRRPTVFGPFGVPCRASKVLLLSVICFGKFFLNTPAKKMESSWDAHPIFWDAKKTAVFSSFTTPEKWPPSHDTPNLSISFGVVTAGDRLIFWGLCPSNLEPPELYNVTNNQKVTPISNWRWPNAKNMLLSRALTMRPFSLPST